MAKVKFRKEDLEEIGSYDEMERIAFGDIENKEKVKSRGNSRSVPGK